MDNQLHISLSPNSLFSKIFQLFVVLFNVLVLSYVITVGYYDQLSLDDYSYLGIMREYGFFSPFKYWYFNWQGRFAPQFLLNVVYYVYDLTGSLLPYVIFLSMMFVYCIYEILKTYFTVAKSILFNYSFLIFSALVLTSFDLTIFFWVNASTMYYGGMLFALLGVALILKPTHRLVHYLMIGFCFGYAGSSSEHIGILCCGFLFLPVMYQFHCSGYRVKEFFSSSRNIALTTALVFSMISFVVMVAAPGNDVRVSATEHTLNPFILTKKALYATVFVCAHIFYKMPQIIFFVPVFALFGCYPNSVFVFPQLAFRHVMLISVFVFLVFIFLGNLPLAYALGRPGPLRAYTYVNFFMVALLFYLATYWGFLKNQYLMRIKIIASISLVALFGIMMYTFVVEMPLVKKYSASVQQRIILLEKYKSEKRRDPVFLPPLSHADYYSINDWWRTLTHMNSIPSALVDIPLLESEIGNPPDWRNAHLRLGLGLKFEVYRATPGDSTLIK